MKCATCGYVSGIDTEYGVKTKPFIEVFGLTGGDASYRTLNDGCQIHAVAFRPDVKAFACPICGTIKMEV